MSLTLECLGAGALQGDERDALAGNGVPVLLAGPPGGAAEYKGASATFGPAIDADTPATAVTPASFVEGEGCQPFNVTFEGRAAVVPRGTCTFVVKARHAQAAGASALVVTNNVDGAPIQMGGEDRSRPASGPLHEDQVAFKNARNTPPPPSQHPPHHPPTPDPANNTSFGTDCSSHQAHRVCTEPLLPNDADHNDIHNDDQNNNDDARDSDHDGGDPAARTTRSTSPRCTSRATTAGRSARPRMSPRPPSSQSHSRSPCTSRSSTWGSLLPPHPLFTVPPLKREWVPLGGIN